MHECPRWRDLSLREVDGQSVPLSTGAIDSAGGAGSCLTRLAGSCTAFRCTTKPESAEQRHAARTTMSAMSCGTGLLKNQEFRPVPWDKTYRWAGECSGRSHQTVADGIGDGRATAAHPQLAADTFDVSHRGPRADAQRRGDLSVRHAPDE
jgi:hypothetical protein